MRDQEQALLFNEGIGKVLSEWSALQLAVDIKWGRSDSIQKALQLHSDIFSWFTLSTGPLRNRDLENMLYHTFLRSLKTEVEDGTVEKVAKKLMKMHEEYFGCTHVRPRVEENGDDDDLMTLRGEDFGLLSFIICIVILVLCIPYLSAVFRLWFGE